MTVCECTRWGGVGWSGVGWVRGYNAMFSRWCLCVRANLCVNVRWVVSVCVWVCRFVCGWYR
jgi:hypothetical protein